MSGLRQVARLLQRFRFVQDMSQGDGAQVSVAGHQKGKLVRRTKMTMTDPIADMLTRIRNAQKSGKDSVSMPHSELKKRILDILRNEGYISNYEESETDGKMHLSIGLKYDKNGMPVIHSIERISKPGIKRYVSYKEIRPVMGGMGVLIISTNKGVMTDRKAKKEKVGGEVICKIW